MRCLQSVQNAAARLVMGIRRCDHISPVLRSCTGFLCCSVSRSRLRLLSTSPCPATPRVTWPTIVSSLPTPASDNCVLLTLEHSQSVGHAAVLEKGPLPPQDHKSGTVCRPISDYVGYHTTSSGGYWRHFYSDNCAE